MSTEYADRLTKEILSKVNGQSKLAEQAMLTLVQRDPRFLQSLVTPYLGGIILHAIERAKKPNAKPMTAPQKQSDMPKVAARKVAPQNIPAKGMDGLMAAWAKSFEKDAPPPSKDGKKVSQGHLNALQALIKKKY